MTMRDAVNFMRWLVGSRRVDEAIRKNPKLRKLLLEELN
jgi:hypothetical protein